MSMLAPDVRSTVNRTKQEMRKESDINVIVARARQGQAVTHVARNMPVFMDVSEVTDYKSALDMLRTTDAFFARLPARVRESFENDPAQFLDAVDTAEGRRKLEAAGLLPPIPQEVPVPQARNPDGTFASDANKDGVADRATPSGHT